MHYIVRVALIKRVTNFTFIYGHFSEIQCPEIWNKLFFNGILVVFRHMLLYFLFPNLKNVLPNATLSYVFARFEYHAGAEFVKEVQFEEVEGMFSNLG